MGNQTAASFLGVGAPEALLVGVVALVVFGPKGLADAAKGVGKALKSFQPTLQELSQVSNDLKNTLQNEIGLDEFQRDIQSIRNSATLPKQPAASTSRDSLDGELPTPSRDTSEASASPAAPLSATAASVKESSSNGRQDAATADDIEQMRAASAAAAWGNVPAELSRPEATVAPAKKKLEDMSMAELEAELAKRKTLIKELSRDA